ncbi:hypothetical protein AMS68_006179 [Peltaster fructicola]|uniref:Uncharacterized protein n=1 Tax=Peltaster fructicola TaxID=286661 RepID=A0A6H0Y0V4_9PEZI|nr:hypothetical protein AMS68_006179 [Peltaster fructicola]
MMQYEDRAEYFPTTVVTTYEAARILGMRGINLVALHQSLVKSQETASTVQLPDITQISLAGGSKKLLLAESLHERKRLRQ